MKWASAGGDGGGVGIRVGGGVRWGGVPCLRVTQTHAGQEPISLLFQRQWENHGGGRFYDPNQTTFLHCHLFFPRGVFFFFKEGLSQAVRLDHVEYKENEILQHILVVGAALSDGATIKSHTC